MSSRWGLGTIAIAIACSCTKPNAAVCCESAVDCASIGISDSERSCSLGLVCQQHACGLPPDAAVAPGPACVVDQDCLTDSPATPFCAPTQTCVECLHSAQCPIADPVCDNGTCRGCAADSECASEICASSTGLCVPETTVAYASPTGSTTASCTVADPCTIQRALAVTDATRDTIKLAPGVYSANLVIANQTIDIIGAGATISSTMGTTLTVNDRGSLHVSGAIIVSADPNGTAVDCASLNNVDAPTLVLEEVDVESARAGVALDMCSATIERSKIHVTGSNQAISGIDQSTASVDRTEIFGGGVEVLSGSNSILHFTNSIIGRPSTGSSGFAALGGAIFVSFSTVIDALASCSNTAPVCSGSAANGLCFDNSIIANLVAGAPTNTVTGANCVARYTLVYPQATALAGTGNQSNVNPLLKDPANNDLHLVSGSPAIDAADPAAVATPDFDGLARPQGSRSDLGAYESPSAPALTYAGTSWTLIRGWCSFQPIRKSQVVGAVTGNGS